MMFQSQDSRIIAIEATTNPDNNSRINQRTNLPFTFIFYKIHDDYKRQVCLMRCPH